MLSLRISKRNMFTLIELLIVVSIIAILAALLLPALAKAKYRAKHVLCQGQLKQIVTGITLYTQDFNRKYFHGNTHGSDAVPARVRGDKIYNNSSSDAQAEYYGFNKYGNYLDMTVRNPLFTCPQGINEVPWRKRFARFAHPTTESYPVDGDNQHLTHSSDMGQYTIYANFRVSNSHQDQLNYTMQKLGQAFSIDTSCHGGFCGLTWNDPSPLVSDMAWSSGFGMAMATNHVFGGDRKEWVHFAFAPLYWSTFTGVGEANYAMDDGSVQQMKNLSYSNFGQKMQWLQRLGVGNDASHIPKDWAGEYKHRH